MKELCKVLKKMAGAINDGYCLWLSAKADTPSKLLRTSLEILPLEDLILEKRTFVRSVLRKN